MLKLKLLRKNSAVLAVSESFKTLNTFNGL